MNNLLLYRVRSNGLLCTICLLILKHDPVAGILEVLYCILIESPEVLNIIQENHIKSIIALLDKHGRNHKVCITPLASHRRSNLYLIPVLRTLCSLGVGRALLAVCV